MRVASRSDHPPRKRRRAAVTGLAQGARQPSTPDPQEPLTAPHGQNESCAINTAETSKLLAQVAPGETTTISDLRPPTSDLRHPRRRHRPTRRNEGFLPSARHVRRSHNCRPPDLAHKRRRGARHERH